jgi:small subunit ribosomal protein S13
LTYIYGIGISTSKKILADLKIPYEKKVGDMDDKELKAITDVIKEMILENDLRREIAGNIKRLKEIKCYRGMRHNLGLPVRGQNTRKRGATAKKLLGRSRVRPVLKK